MIKDSIIKFRVYLNEICRKRFIVPSLRKRLKNQDFTLVTNNCNGAFMLHDLGLRFNSPFVNLWLESHDFVKYCSNMAHYRECELRFADPNQYGVDYPVGLLDDLVIYFQHYASEEEAKQKWTERSARMREDNLRILYTAKGGWSYEDVVAIDKLPYAKKIMVNKHYPEIKSAVYISGFDKEEEVGILSRWIPFQFWGRRYYDQLDFVSFFNGEK